jgi:hypothetical protein
MKHSQIWGGALHFTIYQKKKPIIAEESAPTAVEE